MTLVNIDLRNVAGETGRHDQVVFHAPVHREGSAGQTIQTAPVIVDLEGGIGSVDLDPGPVVVEIRARGWEDTAPKTVMVPEEGPITLTGLLLDAFEWAPVVVSEVRALAQWVETVANAFGSLEGVAVSVQAAEAAAESAEADRVVVEQAAMSASWSGDRLTVLGATSPPLTGDKGDKGDKGDQGPPGEVTAQQMNAALAGKADLVGGQVPTSQIPAVALTKPHQVNSLSEMLALPAEEGDVAVITSGDWKGTYMLGAGASHVAASWIRLSGPDAPVQSVNGQSGTVVLGASDVGAAPATHSHTASQISDATTVGRAVLTAASHSAARQAIGAGTSSLTLGTTASTAAAGNHTHSQYAEASRVTTLENSQPIIVSSMDPNPLPGRIYIVTE